MRAKVLLGCCAFLVLAAFSTKQSIDAQGAYKTVNVDVRIDCLAGRGVSFSLSPWAIVMNAGDSLTWSLDSGANVSEMQVIAKQGKPWPFRDKPPYKSTKAKPAGARALDPGQNGRRYQYAVSAVCTRDSVTADTVIIDPDIIIIRGGGT
jgi:hypothetical protein